MALVFSLILFPALAAAETCKGDVPKPAGHALLQTSKSHVGQLESVHQDIANMERRVQSMIKDVQATHRQLSPGEKSAIELMNESLANISIPAIHAGHSDDQLVMNLAHSNLLDCTANLQSDAAAVGVLNATVDTRKKGHAACRYNESILAAEKESKWEELQTFHSGLTVPSFQLPSEADSLEAFFSEGESACTWFDENKQTYTAKKGAYTDAKATWESEQVKCNSEQAGFESAYCQWVTSASLTNETYQNCWGQRSQAFEDTSSAVLDSAQQREAEYTSIRKIQCYLSVLSGPIDMIQSRLDACESRNVSTEFLSIANTTQPNKTSTSDLGDYALKPGDAAWASLYYGSYYTPISTTPVQAVTPCTD